MRKILSIILVFSFLLVGIDGVIAAEKQLKINEKAGVGKYLTDSEGMTLYWFKKDSPGKSTCVGACIEKWPIFYAEKIIPPKGIKKEDFATITREDGKKQTTFRGYPLYYWVNDRKPGDTNGHGVNDVWFVINPDNFPPK